jgi:hypothetical protein
VEDSWSALALGQVENPKTADMTCQVPGQDTDALKKDKAMRVQWLMPVISATPEAEVQRIKI